jgi:diacylglycerol kinase family enzyme
LAGISQKKVLVVVNPASAHNGQNVYEDSVKPVLEMAGVDVDVVGKSPFIKLSVTPVE